MEGGMGSMPALGFLPPELNKAGLSRVGRDWKHKALHHVKALECPPSASHLYCRGSGLTYPRRQDSAACPGVHSSKVESGKSGDIGRNGAISTTSLTDFDEKF